MKRVAWRLGLARAPWRLNRLPRLALDPGSEIAPPWPDIWIAAGRATLPLSARMRRWSAGQTFVVQTQNPRANLSAFDLVIPPEHDGLAGPNVFPILGAPNRLTPERLAEAARALAPQLASLPSPRVAVVIGGRSKAFDLPVARAEQMAREIAQAVQAVGGSVMVSFTRRTPPAAVQALRGGLCALPGVIWDGAGANPYLGFLGSADAVLVTEDSTSLAGDAAVTGKPVHILAMDGASAKFSRFHGALREAGVSRPFAGDFTPWRYPPHIETTRAAAELLRRYDARPNP